MNSGHTISFTVNGKPPKKSDGSCWGNKEAKYVIKLRERALEARTEAGLDSCFKGPVKLELTVYAENVMNRSNTSDYLGDLDTLIAGVMESLQPAPTVNKEMKIHQILKEREDIGYKIPLILKDDSQVVTITAKKIPSRKSYYVISIWSEEE